MYYPFISNILGLFSIYPFANLQVGLLNQESLIDTIQNAIESKLMNSNTTRIFQIQVIYSLTLLKQLWTYVSFQ